eukprot:5400013-Prymnesium_polylepis.1
MVSRAGSGPAARAPSQIGRGGSPGGGRRRRTSCARSARPTGRSCRPGVAVPALSTLRSFPHLEPLIVSTADHDSCTLTHRASAQFMVRRSAHDALDGWSAPEHFRPSLARGLWAEPPIHVITHTTGQASDMTAPDRDHQKDLPTGPPRFRNRACP